MCKTLFAHDTFFRDSLKRLDRWVQAEIGGSIIDYVFNEQVSALIPFDATLYSNQAVFCFEYALTQSLLSRGVYPDVLLGASLGEVVSAAVSGALSPKECIGLLAVSARVLAQTCEPGGMLSVFAPPSLFDEDRLLHDNCEIASVSFDRHFVVAAQRWRIEQVEAHLKAGNHITSRLPVEYGFHSSAIDPARSALHEHYGNSTPGHPLVPVFSCQKKAIIRAYEVDHFDTVIRELICFKETLAILELQGPNLYVDVSPSGTLSTYCKYILHPDSKSRTVPVYTPFSKHGTLDPALWLL